MRKLFSLVAVVTLVAIAPTGAQHRLLPVSTMRGEPALEIALRKLDTIGTLMMTTAHPDDENNAMLAYYGHGRGFRTTLVSATRGEGGQNEIGPELFESLAVLRTEELLAVHRFDGAEQFFTRAVDFGFSFSVDETLRKWGHDEILGDFVRHIRTIRPDVIVAFLVDGTGGGQHHQTTGRLTAEAFRAAADPAKFPEQLAQGLRPWQAKKLYYTIGFEPGAASKLSGPGAQKPFVFTGGEAFDDVLGRTYDEISGEARSMHKCQGMSQLLPLPGPGARPYRLLDTVLPDGVDRADKELFDGVDTSLAALAAYAGPNPPAILGTRLSAIVAAVKGAREALATKGDEATVPFLVEGLGAVRTLRNELASVGLAESARADIDEILARKIQQFSDAIALAVDARLEAVADDGLVVPGQVVGVQLVSAIRARVPVTVTSKVSGLEPAPAPEVKPDTRPAFMREGGPAKQWFRVPADARPTAAHFRYATDAARFIVDPDVPFGAPFRPTPFTATFTLSVQGADVTITVPIQWRSGGNIFSGEKRAELLVVPPFAATVSPAIVIVPSVGAAPRATSTAAPRTSAPRANEREIRVTVTNGTKGAAKAEVQLGLPEGWTSTPASAPVAFSREDEAVTVRFMVFPRNATPGESRITARVVEGGTTYDAGYQAIEYPHTTRRHVIRKAEAVVKVLDMKTVPGVRVGYVMGVGDQVPDALVQIGANVELIDADTLAWGDLSRYRVIITGVRAYERRADLRANNHRLIEFARKGGTVLVQYNKFEFNDAQYGPLPAKVSAERVTDENGTVVVLAGDHPVFNAPNKVNDTTWQGWVQERGLYFLGDKDPAYRDLLEISESFEYNKGTKRGALVEATVGQGRWMYIGLGLWRQLPAGTPGAYQLLANLVGLGAPPRTQTPGN